MTKIIEKKVKTILRPTGINLAPYVVNPYQGCEFACLFCYAQFSKVAQKEQLAWGDYVKVKINALEIFKKELKQIKPKQVLIGSITEPFQPVEKKYHLTEGIINVLNNNKVEYVIMSRSLLLKDHINNLDRKLCQGVYFTLDMMPDKLKGKLQKYKPPIAKIIELINDLSKSKIKTVAYLCPVMPFLFKDNDIKKIDKKVKLEFEIINFQMANLKNIIKTIENLYPKIAQKYKMMCTDKEVYSQIIKQTEKTILDFCKKHKRQSTIHKSEYKDYFKNIYR